MANHHTKVLIIGSGPAGYTAAIYAARGMLEPILVAGMQQGGQLTITTDVENYPGYADPVQGPWMMEQMLAQAQNVGAKVINDSITKAELNVRPFRFEAESGDTFTADSVIVEDLLPPGLRLLPGTLKVDGVAQDNELVSSTVI